MHGGIPMNKRYQLKWCVLNCYESDVLLQESEENYRNRDKGRPLSPLPFFSLLCGAGQVTKPSLLKLTTIVTSPNSLPAKPYSSVWVYVCMCEIERVCVCVCAMWVSVCLRVGWWWECNLIDTLASPNILVLATIPSLPFLSIPAGGTLPIHTPDILSSQISVSLPLPLSQETTGMSRCFLSFLLSSPLIVKL